MTACPRLETESFGAWIVDNRKLGVHEAGYNGVASLTPWATGNNLFVPTFGGMNCELISLAGLEHYRHPSGLTWEPRLEPMHIESADGERVVLVTPETSHSHVSMRTTFAVAQPHYLHKRVELTAHRRFCADDEANRLVVLWANYIHRPPDPHVYLKEADTGGPLSGWVALTQEHHGAPQFQVYRMPADGELSATEHRDFIAGSLAPHEHWPRRTDRPLEFFYGLVHDEHMVLLMFKQPQRVRLAYSPHGGGQHPVWSPAWDYVFHLEDAKVGERYVWDLCLAVKPFAGRADVLEEVRRYSAPGAPVRS